MIPPTLCSLDAAMLVGIERARHGGSMNGSSATLVMKPEKSNQYDSEASDHPVCQADQPIEMANWRTQIAIAQDVVIAVAGHAVALDHHALDSAPGMLLVTNGALASGALKRIKIMRDKIG